MNKKRITLFFSIIILTLLICLSALYMFDIQIKQAEAQCTTYTICSGSGCCGGTTISSVRVAANNWIELCY